MAIVNYYPMKDIIGSAGCRVLEWFELYGVIVFQSISFSTSLFRYMCIVQPDRMRRIGLSPLVIQKTITDIVNDIEIDFRFL